MKKIVIFLFCLMFSIIGFGQNSSKEEITLPKFRGVKNVATLNAGNSALVNKYIKENFVCPKRAVECNLEGTEIIQFTVKKTGNLEDFKVINSVCSDLDQEVIRVLKTTNGMWSPGVKNGKPADMINEATVVLYNHNQSTLVKQFVRKAARYYKCGNKIFLVKNKPEKAIQYFNKAMLYAPNDQALLIMRGLCRYAMGVKQSARNDWNRIVALGKSEAPDMNSEIANLEGYSEMKEILALK